MIDWDMLGIEPTTELIVIKKAYARKLKEYHPEDHPEGFKRLRKAYEAAVQAIKSAKDNPSFFLMNAKGNNEVPYENQSLHIENIRLYTTSGTNSLETYVNTNNEKTPQTFINEFMKRVEELYRDATKRNDTAHWEQLLQEEMLWNLEIKIILLNRMSAFLQDNHEMLFDILLLLNEYFMWEEEPDRLIDRFFSEEEFEIKVKESDNIIIKIRAVNMLFNRGINLQKKEEFQQAIEIFDKLINKYKDSANQKISIQVAQALFEKGDCLMNLEKLEKEIEAYDELINRFENSEHIIHNTLVIKAVCRKVYILIGLKRTQEALALCDKALTNPFSDSENREIRNAIARILYNKGTCLEKLRKKEESIAMYCRLIKMSSENKDKEIQTLANLAKKGVMAQSQNYFKTIIYPLSIIALLFYLMILRI